MGYYCLGDPSTTAWRHAHAALGPARPRPQTSSPSPERAHGPALVDGADFQCVASLWFPERWRDERQGILRCMVAAALRGAPAKDEGSGSLGESAAALEACRTAVVCFALVKRLHALFHQGAPAEEKKKGPDTTAWTKQAESAQARITADEVKMLAACEELVAVNEEELAPCESLSELLDAAELLQDITPPGDAEGFLQSAAASNAGIGAAT